ncbi:PREDICTED: interleukin-18-like [Cyprinodon variegatus]|uniref:interleukin-18-like n=1 Tax=Cyprinodon variegatus TaxID=28743 RepID=UPI00074287B1|nr:PREDICTED: interleukin-18-like [Cyprinodon variegatus]
MATCKEVPLAFFQTLNNSIYFRDSECDSGCEIQEDSFRNAGKNPKSCWIQSLDQKFLVFKAPGNLEFESRTLIEQKEPDSTFSIQIYNDTNISGRQPVMLNVANDGKKLTVTCQENKEVSAEEMDPNGLNMINGAGHKAIFRWQQSNPGKYMFESTLFPGFFLALEEADACLHKLVLRRVARDEVDESAMFMLTTCSS